jgi:mannosyltransferase OCH1-like enzyme
MAIPRIVHQLWKVETVPARWRDAVHSVRRYHKGWEYRLWTDELMDRHVRTHHPELQRAFAQFERQIMRVDVFRYVLMHDFGGLYCDLDYEFVRPYDYSGADVVLSLEYDIAYGDDADQIANYFFASAPQHQLWKDVLAAVQFHPPSVADQSDVCVATGPAFLTGVFKAHSERYQNVRLAPKPVFSPRRVHGRRERKFYVNSGITYGFHHGWGSWRDRANAAYLKQRLLKLLRIKPAAERERLIRG